MKKDHSSLQKNTICIFHLSLIYTPTRCITTINCFYTLKKILNTMFPTMVCYSADLTIVSFFLSGLFLCSNYIMCVAIDF